MEYFLNFHSLKDDEGLRITECEIYEDIIAKMVAKGVSYQSISDIDNKYIGQKYALKYALDMKSKQNVSNDYYRFTKEERTKIWEDFLLKKGIIPAITKEEK